MLLKETHTKKKEKLGNFLYLWLYMLHKNVWKNIYRIIIIDP